MPFQEFADMMADRILRYAVQRAIFCPCGTVLDCRTATMLETSAKTYVVCPDCLASLRDTLDTAHWHKVTATYGKRVSDKSRIFPECHADSGKGGDNAV